MEEIFFVKNDFYRFSYRNTRRLANLPVHICVEIFHTPDSLILLNLKLLFLITNISVQSMLHEYNKGDRFSSYRLCYIQFEKLCFTDWLLLKKTINTPQK